MPDHNYFGTHAAELDELTYHLIEGADGVLPQVIQRPEYRQTRAVDRKSARGRSVLPLASGMAGL